MLYEDFKKLHKEPKYFGLTCYIPKCNCPAEYEGGDGRFYCGVCEQHSNVKEAYKSFKKQTQPCNKYSSEVIKNFIGNTDYNKYIF